MFSFLRWVKTRKECGGALPFKAEFNASQGIVAPSTLHLPLFINREGEIWAMLSKLVRCGFLAWYQVPSAAALGCREVAVLCVPAGGHRGCKSSAVAFPHLQRCSNAVQRFGFASCGEISGPRERMEGDRHLKGSSPASWSGRCPLCVLLPVCAPKGMKLCKGYTPFAQQLSTQLLLKGEGRVQRLLVQHLFDSVSHRERPTEVFPCPGR